MIALLSCQNEHAWEVEVDRDIGVLCFIDDDAMFCPECGEAGSVNEQDGTMMKRREHDGR